MIQFEDVQIRYGNATVIDHLNLEINTGEFFTFLGASGCGKTTTLRALAGFLAPSRGDIRINGQQQYLGIIHQRPGNRHSLLLS